MERYYQIAGIDICIKGNAEELYPEDYRLAAFRSEKKEYEYLYEYSIAEELAESSGNCIFHGSARRVYQDGKRKIHYFGTVKEHLEHAHVRSVFDSNVAYVQVKRSSLQDRITNKLVLNSMNIEGLLLKHHTLLLHASFIEVNGRAILFTAPSGTGKSTQADLWKQYRDADIINGDRVAIKVDDKTMTACGIPFAGSSRHCKNATLPIAAIVYLAQGMETKILPFKGMQAFKKILNEVTIPVWEAHAVERVSDMLLTVLNHVPVYHLECTPDESAVIALENVLNREV